MGRHSGPADIDLNPKRPPRMWAENGLVVKAMVTSSIISIERLAMTNPHPIHTFSTLAVQTKNEVTAFRRLDPKSNERRGVPDDRLN